MGGMDNEAHKGTMPPCWLDDEPARALSGALGRAGIAAWATGGAVRDGIARREPATVEILVGADGRTLRDALGGTPFETPRGRAGRPAPGRPETWRPTSFSLKPLGKAVSPARLDRDALGRDFTVNAVRCDLSGRIEDPLGGVADLALGRVRLAAPSALRDDPVRVLRYARMRAILGEGKPDPEAMTEAEAYACRLADAAPAEALSELVRIMRLPEPAMLRAIGELDEMGALEAMMLSPDPGRLRAFLDALPQGRLRDDPLLRLGMLALAPTVGGRWVNGLVPRWGDRRDARVDAVSGLLVAGTGQPRHGLRPADAATVMKAALSSLA